MGEKLVIDPGIVVFSAEPALLNCTIEIAVKCVGRQDTLYKIKEQGRTGSIPRSRGIIKWRLTSPYVS